MESSPTSNPPPSPNPPVTPFNSQPLASFSSTPLPFQSDEHPTLLPTHPTVGNFLTIQWRSDSIQSSPQPDVSLPTFENPLLVRTKDLCSLEKSSSGQQTLFSQGFSSSPPGTDNRSSFLERPMSYSRTRVYRKQHKPRGDHHPYYASEAHNISSRSPHSLDVIQGIDGEHPHSLQMVPDIGNKGADGISNIPPPIVLSTSVDDDQGRRSTEPHHECSLGQDAPQGQ
ncbi:hypothetical protein SLE2022_204570 [Rubroshorea leprosula]